MRRANKVEQHLSSEQLEAFNERLAGLKGVTLQNIADIADEFGVEISLPAASTYRNTSYKEYLAELKSKANFAETLAQAAKSGQSMTDAAASILSSKMLTTVMDSGELEIEELNELSLAVSRLRLGEQRAAKLASDLDLAKAKLAEYEAKEAERKQIADRAKETLKQAQSKGAITEETMRSLEEQIGLL